MNFRKEIIGWISRQSGSGFDSWICFQFRWPCMGKLG